MEWFLPANWHRVRNLKLPISNSCRATTFVDLICFSLTITLYYRWISDTWFCSFSKWESGCLAARCQLLQTDMSKRPGASQPSKHGNPHALEIYMPSDCLDVWCHLMCGLQWQNFDHKTTPEHILDPKKIKRRPPKVGTTTKMMEAACKQKLQNIHDEEDVAQCYQASKFAASTLQQNHCGSISPQSRFTVP